MLNMKKIFISSLILSLGLLGCGQDDQIDKPTPDTPAVEAPNEASAHVITGKVRVRLTPELGNTFAVQATQGGLRSGHLDMDTYLQQIGARSMQRVFPHAGKYEARTRKKGLHLWYDIVFDDQVPSLRAARSLEEIKGVDLVEVLYEPMIPETKTLIVSSLRSSERSGSMPFDDPMLPYQWHYNNTGEGLRFVRGADINLFKAWEVETGKSNVVVAVTDGGIDLAHEDLVDNLFINQVEKDGTEGVDDDQNGFVDDIHGYNFVSNTGRITAHKHGTHVAGTVAARNNNGIGVGGVAGGNGTPGSGVRMMSCQTFEHSTVAGEPDKAADGALAIKYSADAGAIISQNSWGYQYPGPGRITPSMAAAIDYFIDYAGCDENGNQRPDSPMKGGVVIFAAGNDYLDYEAFPGAYSRVISVSSMGPDFKITDYSNKGAWISIAAPGGNDWLSGGEVLSTYPKNQYSLMVGTSMACPHVSGIAALIVSKYGGPGFTNEELKSRLMNSVYPLNINEENPRYSGRVGRGYIDAQMALMTKGDKYPEDVKSASVVSDFTGLKVVFSTVADEDDGVAVVYRLYASPTAIDASNYLSARYKRTIPAHFARVGDELTYSFTGLDLNTQYYFALVAEDRWGHSSKPYFFSGKTSDNHAPSLEWVSTPSIRLSGSQSAQVVLRVTELDGHSWEYMLSGEQRGVHVRRQGEELHFTLRAIAPVGHHRTTIRVIDVYGATTEIDLPFEVYTNQAPILSQQLPRVFIPKGVSERQLRLTDYITDPDGDALTYQLRVLSNASDLVHSLQGDVLSLKPSKLGASSLEITASDASGATLRAILAVQSVESDLVYRVYPIPASTELNLDLSRKATHAHIEVRTSTGAKVRDWQVNLSAGTSDSSAVKLDLSSVAPGTYILYVDLGGRKYSQSFVKI